MLPYLITRLLSCNFFIYLLVYLTVLRIFGFARSMLNPVQRMLTSFWLYTNKYCTQLFQIHNIILSLVLSQTQLLFRCNKVIITISLKLDTQDASTVPDRIGRGGVRG